MDGVLYFAEYLARIKSIAVSLQFPHGATATNVRFKDLRTAVVHYSVNGTEKAQDLSLPEDVTVKVSEGIIDFKQENSTVSFRLPASPELHEQYRPKTSFLDKSATIPWTASQIQRSEAGIKLRCKSCGSVVSESIKAWKDMPSEHWAETMDFWHCHKPHDEFAHSFNKAYSVSQFVPMQGSAFISAAYFLVKAGDTTNISIRNGTVVCSSCDSNLGEDHMDYLQLWKWSLCIDGGKYMAPEYPSEVFISCILLDLVDSHAIFTFLIEGDRDKKMLLWVFNLDVKLVTGRMDRAVRALKIFYSSEPEDIVELQQSRGDVEIVRLPGAIFDYLEHQLIEYTNSFPENARLFGKWNVSILRRHDTSDGAT